MRRIFFLILCLTFGCVQACSASIAPEQAVASPPVLKGPFDVRQFLVLYVVNPTGEAFTINMKCRDELRREMDRPVLVRVFDPEEHMLIHHDEPGEKSDVIEFSATLQVPASGAGVYQVAITAFTPTIEFNTEPPLSFGVFGYPYLACRDQQFADAYIDLPPGLTSLQVRAGEQMQAVTIRDEADAEKLKIAGAGAVAAALPSDGDQIWRFSAVANKVGTLNFGGMPIILCPDETSARAIHSSVDVLDDGTICFHKFQVRAHEILKRYRGMPPSAFVVRPLVMVRQKQAWLAEPVRNQLLLGPYGVFSGLDVSLAEQVVDGRSPWFGCIRPPRTGGAAEGNPWTTYTRLGLTRAAPTISTLAAVHSVHERFNPLAGDQALRNRICIAALQELMMLREFELPFPEIDEYQGGERAFTFARSTLAFPLVVRECPEDVRDVWTEGLRRWVDHESVSQVCLTTNQWSFIIRAIQQFAEGVDDPWYHVLVQRHLRWLLTRNQFGHGFMPAGYFTESGPDATYSGIGLHNLGWVQRRTNDPKLLDALRQTYNLFNHTVAPEAAPNTAVWMGSTAFGSRTPNDWNRPQWTAGVNMMCGEIAEAAPLIGRAWMSQAPPIDAAMLRFAEQQTTSMLTNLDRQAFEQIGERTLTDAGDIGFASWQAFAERPLHGRLPVLESNSFTRVFADEFMCVRRPSYYTFIYTGKPMADWQRQSRELNTRRQYPRNGGGLCMFWSPGMGSSLLAKNWSAYASQCIIAERDRATGDGDWEDYWSVRPDFDADDSRATVRSAILNQPMQVERTLNFLHDAVRCDVRLTIDSKPNAAAVWECFPFALEKADPMHVALMNDKGEVVANGPASAIIFRNGGGFAHLIVFAQPRVCDVGEESTTDNYDGARRHGRVLAQLPNALEAGESRVKWMMLPTSGDAKVAIAEALKRLRNPDGE